MILGIETATSSLGVALAHEGRIAASIVVARKNVHDDLLVPLCRELVTYAGLRMEDVGTVAVSAGPGSYTGLRIGMAAAKGLCLGLGIPLVAVPTCDAAAGYLAGSGACDEEHIAVCLDAKNDEVYIATYVVRNDSAIRRHPVAILSSTDAASLLDGGTLLVGDGAARVAEQASVKIRVAVDPTAVFRGDGVALLGERLAGGGEFCDIASCEPLYLREFIAKRPRNPLAH